MLDGSKSSIEDFYPRSPCGERQLYIDRTTKAVVFLSTLSLRRATRNAEAVSKYMIFLSTLSLRRATHQECSGSQQPADFYPRSPCGERLKPPVKTHRQEHFYPRSPCGERHNRFGRPIDVQLISIHALLAESDGIIDIINNVINNFYPRSPCGERLHAPNHSLYLHNISIHALLAESDTLI